MALKGLDIFKLSPKKNCKECGSPTCMAFCMKVAQGAVSIDKCPYFSDDAKAMLNEQTAPPMKTIAFGDHKLGGETVLYRHEKTLVNKNLFAVSVSTAMSAEEVDRKLSEMQKVDSGCTWSLCLWPTPRPIPPCTPLWWRRPLPPAAA